MKLVHVGWIRTLLVVAAFSASLPGAGHAEAGPNPTLFPQMVSATGYLPLESRLYTQSDGSSRHSRSHDMPPVDIFGNSPTAPFSHIAIGLSATTLGGALQLATPLGNYLNLRVGGNFVRFQYPFTKDGVNYRPQVDLRSGQGTIDWFPANGEFHVSAGALYFRNDFAGSADVQAGQTYKLGDTTYLNSVDDPVSGTVSLSYGRKVAPMLLLGWGNLIPRTGRRFTIPVEFGVAYMGAPQTTLHLTGTSCTTDGCFDNATDPSTLNNIKQEQKEINNDLRYTKFYPVLSLGVAYRF